MRKKIDTDIFIEKSKNVHGNKYDYSLVEYKDAHSKVKIICKKHGIFEQKPSKHLIPQNCPYCVGNIRKTNKEFIKCAIDLYGDKYDYSKVNYKNVNQKIEILCKIHNLLFKQTPRKHLIGNGCPKCNKNVKYTNESFINRANIIHNNKYDYSLVEYKCSHSKIKIICKEHGIFEQLPYCHLKGNKCPDCTKNKKSTTEKFIIKANVIHNFQYDYSLTNYKNNSTKVKIICPEHGIFEQIPDNHLKGCKCSKCKNYSIGEEKIEKILNKNNILFETQKQFAGCSLKQKLKFDFYLPDRNLCIEFDGQQHYEKYRFEKDDRYLNLRKKRDEIKNIYCQENNIELLRIKYTDNIENKLNEILNDNKIQ
jgi:very-short-patch-repair endonuclease